MADLILYRVDICHHHETTYRVRARTPEEAILLCNQGAGDEQHFDDEEICHEVAEPIEEETNATS